MKWWIKYTDGSKHYFDAFNRDAAYRFAMLDGDHVLEFGSVKENKDEPSSSVKGNKDTRKRV